MENTKTVKLLRFDVKNLNNIIYSMEDFTSSLEDFKSRITENNGVYGHPGTFNASMANASHIITDLYIEGDFLMGEIKILDTQKGNDLLEIIDSVVFRTQDAGIVNPATNKKLFTFDAIDENNDPFKGLM